MLNSYLVLMVHLAIGSGAMSHDPGSHQRVVHYETAESTSKVILPKPPNLAIPPGTIWVLPPERTWPLSSQDNSYAGTNALPGSKRTLKVCVCLEPLTRT